MFIYSLAIATKNQLRYLKQLNKALNFSIISLTCDYIYIFIFNIYSEI